LLIYGKKGCLVANIPGKNILNKGQAFPLESSFLPLKNLDTDQELGFVDVQFSILNSNYVLALTSDSKFYAISLLNDLRFE
jgi:hypothetical protein